MKLTPAVKEYMFAHVQGGRKRPLTMARPQIWCQKQSLPSHTWGLLQTPPSFSSNSHTETLKVFNLPSKVQTRLSFLCKQATLTDRANALKTLLFAHFRLSRHEKKVRFTCKSQQNSFEGNSYRNSRSLWATHLICH